MSALFLFPVFQHLNGQKSGHCVQQQRWTDVTGVSPFSFSSIPTLEWSEKRKRIAELFEKVEVGRGYKVMIHVKGSYKEFITNID